MASTIENLCPLGTEFPDLMLCKLPHLGLLSLSGEQTRQFMQGQVTSDIQAQTSNEWLWGAHCDPKGKMIATFRSFFKEDALYLLMPKETIPIDLAQLQKYAVFNKVNISDVTDNWTLLGLAGTQAKTWLQDQYGELSENITVMDDGLIIKDNDRFILMFSHAKADAIMLAYNQSLSGGIPWKALEIQSGYPNIYASTSGQFIPQMCNLQALNGISFTKGCYMGQETVARIKYRGGNKRALYILTGTCHKNVHAKSVVELQMEDGNYKKAGTIIEYSQHADKLILSVVMANDMDINHQFRIADDEQSQLTIISLPYSLEE